MERTRIDFNLLDTVDYVLSSFFTVPTADHQTSYEDPKVVEKH